MQNTKKITTLAISLALLSVSVLGASNSISTKAYSFQDKIIELVNVQRQNRGIRNLQRAERLARVAQNYSGYLADNSWLSHEQKDGTNYTQRINNIGYNGWTTIGENIARGQENPQEVVSSWMNSPQHRDNILDPAYCEMGAGYSYNSNDSFKHYWTQAFGCGGNSGNQSSQANTSQPEYRASYIKVNSDSQRKDFSTCINNSSTGELYTETSFGFPYDFKTMLYKNINSVPIDFRVVLGGENTPCKNAKTMAYIQFDIFADKDDSVDVFFVK